MNTFFYGLAALMITTAVQAQPAKRLVKIDEKTGELVEIAQAQPEVMTASANPIVIMNNQNQKSGQSVAQTSIQDQPTNIIEDSPLQMSSAERRRRQRQAMEVQTEQTIVEKLEEARIEDERARSERLFNKGFSSREEQPQVVVQPAPAPVEEKKVDVKAEVKAAIAELQPKSEEPKAQYYVQGLIGVGSYPDAKNVKGNGSTGFSIGMITPERIVAEGTFQYTEYVIEQMQPTYSYATPPFKTMNQYNFTAGIKYQILPGRVRPVVGMVAGYTYRKYVDKQFAPVPSADVSTNAFDAGGVIGVDVQLTNSFSVGLDFRYMKNVTYRENNGYQQSFVYQRVGRAAEELDYTMTSLSGRFLF